MCLEGFLAVGLEGFFSLIRHNRETNKDQSPREEVRIMGSNSSKKESQPKKKKKESQPKKKDEKKETGQYCQTIREEKKIFKTNKQNKELDIP